MSSAAVYFLVVISFSVGCGSGSVPAEGQGGAAQEAAHLGDLAVGDRLDGHAPGLPQVRVQPGEMLLRHDDVLADGEDVGVHPVHFLLRELEDICDTVGLLHKGGMLMSEDLDDVKGDVHKIQIVFPDDFDPASISDRLRILESEQRGSLHTYIIRGRESAIKDILREGNPVFMEALPLSLEEIFITSTGVEGYDIKKIIY